jgi:hypothetical protein
MLCIMDTNDNDEVLPFIRALCPDLSEEELKEAEDNLLGYVKIAMRIFERMEREESAVLTEKHPKDRIKEHNRDDAL